MKTLKNGRATITKNFNGVNISIPSKKNWFVLLFATVWMGGWAFGFSSALSVLLDNPPGGVDLFMLVWLTGWTIGGISIVGLLCWGYFGREEIQIQNNQVNFIRSILGLGITKELIKHEVKNIRFNEVPVSNLSTRNNWALWGIGPGKIKMDYGMKTFSFGLALDDAEANYIIELMEVQLSGKKFEIVG